jgi:spermidine/putrescine transport system permease protein
MATVAAPKLVGGQARNAYHLRYDRLAGWLNVAGALGWALLLVYAVGAYTTLPVSAGLLGLVALDSLIGLTLIRGYGRPAARLRAVLGIAGYALYYAATGDFVLTLLLASVQGLILVLLTRSAGLILIYPSMLWLGVFFVVPLISILAFSLGRGTTIGTVDLSTPSLSNYQRILSPVGNSGLVYVNIVLRTIWIAFLNTAICLAIAYPFSFWMARQPQRVRNTLVLLVMIPFWTNILIRTYAWLIILRKDGLVNNLLMNVLGLTRTPLELTNTPGALLLGLVYGYLPYMVLPLYNSIERLDNRMIEAASDLYANPGQAFRRIVLPLTMPGIIAGSILVFIPSIGTYVVTNVLGGGKIFLIGNLLEQQFIGSSGNKAFGAAFGVVMTVLMLIATLVYFRVGRRDAYT